MNSLLFYTIASGVSLGLFITAYQLLLKNNTRFNLCRFYLISAILFSFIIPFITIDVGISFVEKKEVIDYQSNVVPVQNFDVQELPTEPIQIEKNAWGIDYARIAGMVFLSISLLLFARFIFRFGSIILIQNSGNRYENEDGTNLIFTDKTDNAFSFLGSIFINPLKFTDEEKRLIIEHEREHIRHLHSIDLILIELLIVLQWFNPFAYIARRKLIEIHEFIADNGVIRKGADPYSYQNLLLSVVSSSCLPTVGNQLSALITKKRIAMIGKPINQTGRWINFLILVPIAAILIIGVSAFTVKESKNSDNKDEITIPATTPAHQFKKIATPILKPFAREDDDSYLLENVSKNSNLEGSNLKPISRKDLTLLSPNQMQIEKEQLNAVIQKNVDRNIKEELLKRAEAENKYTYLKDLYFQLKPSGSSNKDNSSSYSIILKKSILYKIYFLSGSNEDNLLATIGSISRKESVIENQFTFSNSKSLTFEPKETGAYQIKITNLSSKEAEALVLLSLISESKDSNPDVSNSQIQTVNPISQPDTTEVFIVVEHMPTFGTGKENEFRAWVASNMQYPKEAAEKGIQGNVFVQFVIENDGRVTNAKIIKGVNPALDKEALRVIQLSPKWNPGSQNGKTVRVSYTFPITFFLN